MAYWLFKTEPSVYSFEDLMREPDRATGWEGVRNYQARNYLRDEVRVGDEVFIYHSNALPPAIVGIARVIEPAQADPAAFDPSSKYYDASSKPESPTWYQVRIQGVLAIEPPLGLPALREMPALAGMELLRKGSRLSIQPVRPEEWKAILAMVKPKPKPKPNSQLKRTGKRSSKS